MKLIIFTTCKPFVGDDYWRQEQAIKSWTLLENIEKKIIIIGNDKGTKRLCEKYNLIHEPNVRNLNGVPYLYEMFLIANKYAEDDDVMLWTNSDMIYYQDMIDNIYAFKKQKPDETNYLLVGQRIDWINSKFLKNLSKSLFFDKINLNNKQTAKVDMLNSLYNECAMHAACGIDYVIHSKTTFLNKLDPNLVIAGTRHDMILVGIGIEHNYFTCDITKTCQVIHQNHDYYYEDSNLLRLRKINNNSCNGTQKSITDCKYKSQYNADNSIEFIKK